MAREAFQYSVVRLVPNVVRDEARNVGVLVQPVSGGDLRFKFLERDSSLERQDFVTALAIAENFKEQLSTCIREKTSIGRAGSPLEFAFLKKALEEFNGTLQITPPRGVLAASIGEALAQSFETFVGPAETQVAADASPAAEVRGTAPSVLRRRLWSAFSRTSLVRKGLVHKKFTVPGTHARWTFDLGYERDGTSVVNIVALTASDANTNLSRCLVFKGMIEEVREKQPVHPIAVVAQGPDISPADRRHARAILTDAGAEVLPLARLGALVERVQQAFEPELAGL